jgi:hypothetical protein
MTTLEYPSFLDLAASTRRHPGRHSARRSTTRRTVVARRVAAPQAVGSSTIVHRPAGQAVTITREQVLRGEIVDELWNHYVASFQPLTMLAAQSQQSDRVEFERLLGLPEVTKFVAWCAGQPVGLTVVTNALDLVPELSPGFLRRRYPDHAARNAIFVGVYVSVSPTFRSLTLAQRLYLECWQLTAESGGVLVIDVCEHNRQQSRLEDLLPRMARAFPGASVAEIDRQTWYAMELPHPMLGGRRR